MASPRARHSVVAGVTLVYLFLTLSGSVACTAVRSSGVGVEGKECSSGQLQFHSWQWIPRADEFRDPVFWAQLFFNFFIPAVVVVVLSHPKWLPRIVLMLVVCVEIVQWRFVRGRFGSALDVLTAGTGIQVFAWWSKKWRL
jgi:hypothetical protein